MNIIQEVVVVIRFVPGTDTMWYANINKLGKFTTPNVTDYLFSS